MFVAHPHVWLQGRACLTFLSNKTLQKLESFPERSTLNIFKNLSRVNSAPDFVLHEYDLISFICVVDLWRRSVQRWQNIHKTLQCSGVCIEFEGQRAEREAALLWQGLQHTSAGNSHFPFGVLGEFQLGTGLFYLRRSAGYSGDVSEVHRIVVYLRINALHTLTKLTHVSLQSLTAEPGHGNMASCGLHLHPRAAPQMTCQLLLNPLCAGTFLFVLWRSVHSWAGKGKLRPFPVHMCFLWCFNLAPPTTCC